MAPRKYIAPKTENNHTPSYDESFEPEEDEESEAPEFDPANALPIPYPSPAPITMDTPDKVLYQEDVTRINQAIDMVHNMTARVSSVNPDVVCRMALTTAKLLEVRRKLMRKPYGTDDTERPRGLPFVYTD